ncbi:MAG: transcription-repair coupling factor [Lachnospiraceae bacterium]|nr:transcription-repair coupling factor [Lachnospiraceae bacterium]
MKTFLTPLLQLEEFQKIREQLHKGRTPFLVTGCTDSQKAHLVYGLSQGREVGLIVLPDERRAKEFYQDYLLYNKRVLYYPPKDVIFYSADVHGNAITAQRMKVLRALLEEDEVTVVTTIDAGMDAVLPLSLIRRHVMTVAEGDILDVTAFAGKLAELGYVREVQVEQPGQFAVRGGIIDLFPLTEETPYRIELWDDEVDTIRAFDAESQRSVEQVTSVTIYPAQEFILTKEQEEAGFAKIEAETKKQAKRLRDGGHPEAAHLLESTVREFQENREFLQGVAGIDAYVTYFYDTTVSFFDYFRDLDTVAFLDGTGRLEEKAEFVETEFRESMAGRLEQGSLLPGQTDALIGRGRVYEKLAHLDAVLLSTMESSVSAAWGVTGKFSLTVRSVNPYNNDFELLVSDLAKWKKNGYRILLVSGSASRARRLAQDLFDRELSAFYSEDLDREVLPGETMVISGGLRRGFEYPLIKTVILSDTDIFGARRKKRRKKRYAGQGKYIQSFNELAIGDYVVHESHGLGIYRGIEKLEVDHTIKDYIKLEYGGGGTLYIPATGVDVLQKYAGSDAAKPRLNKLNSPEWKTTKARVKGAVADIAKELVELYAVRESRQGFAFSPDTVWQAEFEEQFPYEETEDQLAAIAATKHDMESRRIMDRLICGDVGYGKTEIAIRAAFKAVSDGKQVVFLVPTTILAQQHYNTFVQRMKEYPLTVEMLSRFRTASEQKSIIERTKKGLVDILIGTHKVLSKNVEFKNLGLLIIDEEQRFGVAHKEKIKQMKQDVDVLTLSATPIPRTLHMSLAGIRDMSVLEEPPVDRVPVQTFVMEHSDEMVREAIVRELARGGQVYYVYNRVNTIPDVAAQVQKLVPDAQVAYAHGKMKERELEQIMMDFVEGEIDVLVSTTIIETGLDISNVNTIIIDDADRLGLAQLYQLRGRVGRSSRTAYAFLMYRRNRQLREVAEKRLQVIREYTDLGSGFRIAMRDLEIRGAGNLLGARQSGHMEAVGYDLYCKMLNEAVRRLRGEELPEEDFETSLDLDVDAYIPTTYIRAEMQRLDMYKRMASITTKEERIDLEEELVDRYGDLPRPVENLCRIALLKAMAHEAFVTQMTQKGDTLKVYFYKRAKIHVPNFREFLAQHRNVKLTTDVNPYLTWRMWTSESDRKSPEEMFEMLFAFVQDLMSLQEGYVSEETEEA